MPHIPHATRYFFIFLVLSLIGCTHPSLHEAQTIVAEADSLWHAGQMYSDSVQLAQAYETLARWQWVEADAYAHSCYHYGKLLRAKDNPVEAMQAFINATHSGTDDYHILGRVYSNMGDICHLAGDYDLSYDMFEKSADMFLQNGDTLLYYYDLANMAIETAEQADSLTTFSILQKIDSSRYSDLKLLTSITRAHLYLKTKQYKKAIQIAKGSLDPKRINPTLALTISQCYSYLNKKDSSTYYAKLVISHSCSLLERNNALYILTNDDTSKDKDAIRQTAAERADTQKLLEIRQGVLSQAIQLLKIDLNREPNLWWLISIIATLVAVGTGGFIYVHCKRKKQELLTQKLDILQQATTTIQEKHDDLAERYFKNHKQIKEEINAKCTLLRDSNTIKKTLAWKNYNRMCTIVDKRFYLLASKLRRKHNLNETEVRICVLTILDCGYDQMAELLFRSTTSIGTLKTRVAKKLGTSTKHLRLYLIDNVCIG